MTCICEFQAFYDDDNQFIIKEMVVVDIQKREYIHLHFLPPYERSKLSSSKQRTVLWLENKFHGLIWEDGSLEFSLKTLKSVLSPFSSIYTKGAEKRNFLKSIVDVKIYDLDKFKSLIPKLCTDNKIVCPVGGRHKANMRCALHKALHLAKWLTRSVMYCDYRREYDRLNSFTNHFQQVKEIVKLGFYENGGSICCVWCGMCYSDRICDVVDKHYKNSSLCDSLIGFVNNIPITLERIIPRESVY